MFRRYDFKNNTFEIKQIDFSTPNTICLQGNKYFNNHFISSDCHFKYNLLTNELTILNLVLWDDEIQILKGLCLWLKVV